MFILPEFDVYTPQWDFIKSSDHVPADPPTIYQVTLFIDFKRYSFYITEAQRGKSIFHSYYLKILQSIGFHKTHTGELFIF